MSGRMSAAGGDRDNAQQCFMGNYTRTGRANGGTTKTEAQREAEYERDECMEVRSCESFIVLCNETLWYTI